MRKDLQLIEIIEEILISEVASGIISDIVWEQLMEKARNMNNSTAEKVSVVFFILSEVGWWEILWET